jgi:tripeptide aminopeptidase
MINAIRMAGEFLAKMPRAMAPEATKDRDQFMHPYTLTGGVDEAKVQILLRSFVTDDLAGQAEMLKKYAKEVEASFPGGKVNVDVKKQYRNMIEHISKEPRTIDLAAEAYRKIGVEPKFQSIRGGTDGSRLSEMGLPTPNLSTGMHNFHSPLEFACLEQMETATKMLVELAQLWGNEK